MQPGDYYLVIRFDEYLENVLSSTYVSKHCSIFRAPKRLQTEKDKTFQPEVLSIGPYHKDCGYVDSEVMERQKALYLKLLLRRIKEDSVLRFVHELRENEEKVREYYATQISISQDNFIKMMLLDGFFIVEQFRRGERPESQDDIQLRVSKTTEDSFVRDLLLLENQLPFFVLDKLFDMTLMEGEPPNQFISEAIVFLSIQGFIRNSDHMVHDTDYGNSKHLLDLLHKCCRPSRLIFECSNKNVNEYAKMELMPCATELEPEGISFKELTDSYMGLFEMRFEDGILSVPKLKLDLQGEKMLLNLLAYEQCCYDALDSRYVTDYVRFMAALIKTGKDVELLRSRGVIDCGYGNDEAVATMFSRLANNVVFSPSTFVYSDIFIKVQSHKNSKKAYWNRKWYSWKAAFWHDYFSTPWGAISVIAASVLLILTIAQTTFTILPYYHPH